jgi:glycerophosphoryl diester phosphodiesterase
MAYFRKNLSALPLFFLAGILLFFISCDEKAARSNSEPTEINFVIDKIKERTKTEILVCAHRAYHQFAPENSIASIEKAIEANIDIVEVDVNTTKDGILILMHDNSIDRTTNGKGYVSDFTFVELNKLYLTINDSVTTHKIPTLSEVLSVAKGKIILNLDIKRVDVAKLYQQLEVYKMQNEVFSFIWDKRKIEKILAIDSTYAVLPEVSNRTEIEYYLENVASKLQHFNENSFTSENVTWAKTQGVEIFMNSLFEIDAEFVNGNTNNIDKIIDLKPAIIQTDHPLLLKEYLKSKGLHH